MSKWQSIKTAPKDGTLILAYDGRYATRPTDLEPEDRWSPYEVVRWCVEESTHWIFVDVDTRKRERRDVSHWQRSQGSWFPTYWMPLPKPPSEDTT